MSVDIAVMGTPAQMGKVIVSSVIDQRAERQHKLGKKTAWERLDSLLDQESFEELDHLAKSPFLEEKFTTDGVITGFGTIHGRQVAVYAQDFTIKGGSLGKRHADKICKIMDMAAKIGCPIIGVIDSGGARIDEGVHALSGYGQIFTRNVKYSGIVPQVSIILGPCAGGATYSPALTDFIFTTTNTSNMFITGPQVVEQVLHQKVTKEELGGALVHAQKSGVAHFVANNEDECLEQVKKLLSYLPQNYLSEPSSYEIDHDSMNTNFANLDFTSLNPAEIVPQNFSQSYDIRNLICSIFDPESFFEIHEYFAPNIVVGFARLNGKIVGLVANQPQVKAGVIDIDASCKAARFINFCDAFSIPIISLVDVPGFLPGVEQEHNGIIRHGAKLIYAYAAATVPKITLIIRKAFGGAYVVMGSKELGTDFNFSWPNSQIAVLGAKGAIAILHRSELANALPENREALIQKLEADYEREFMNPVTAAENGYIDAIIEPIKTRYHLIRALEILKNKVEQTPKKKHGNIPL
ncbi:MAG: acyl-CoA carboxylase subunit beta [Candidatus Babeliales bacterium]